MSVNKNALIRYQVLDRCFRNSGRMYFWEDLLEECNKALIVSACTSEKYTSELIKIFKRDSIDFYFPGTDIELIYCAQNKKFFKENFFYCRIHLGINFIFDKDDTICSQ